MVGCRARAVCSSRPLGGTRRVGGLLGVAGRLSGTVSPFRARGRGGGAGDCGLEARGQRRLRAGTPGDGRVRACDGSVKILYFFLIEFWKVVLFLEFVHFFHVVHFIGMLTIVHDIG